MIRCFLLAFLFVPGLVVGQGLRALPEGQSPNDSRLKPPITLHGYHPFRGVGSKEEWEVRQKEIIRRIAVGCGLWPQPSKTPLNEVVHKKIDQGDYTVESVFFESMPGHYVTGNLYRPAGESLKVGMRNGKRPGVLCAHGHWQDARFAHKSDEEAKKQIEIGAERFINGGKSIHQARCVQLARMGCVVFFYDMLGNGDSKQFPEHRRGPRPAANGEAMGEWGFVSKNATARLQTNFGLQTWNSIRAVDFILGQEGVDADRILVTGASGGATQTMMVSALDERVKAAFPCVMVSTAMQGGCTCENTHYLRIGQGNIDIAAAVAPRPLGLTAADDWTIELEKKGHPDLLKLFEMVDAEEHYEAHFDVHFKHNYNSVSRSHLYQFVNRHFELGLKSPVLERDFELLGKKELSVFDEKHPAPSGAEVGLAHEKTLNRWWAEDSDKQVEVLLDPKNKEDFAKTQKVIGGALEVMIGRKLPGKGDVNFELVSKEARDGFMELSGLVKNTKHDEEVPASFLYPLGSWAGHVVIWLSPDGKSGIFREGAEPKEEVRKLLKRGVAVMGVDLFAQGEFLNSEQLAKSSGKNPGITYSRNQNAKLPADSWQRSPVYYYGYNDSTFARRVHDVLTAVSFAKYSENYDVKKISLVGSSGAGHWAAAARAIAGGEMIQKAWLDTRGLRFNKLASHWEADFLPGAVKYGDVAGLLLMNSLFDTMMIDGSIPLLEKMESTSSAFGGKVTREGDLASYFLK